MARFAWYRHRRGLRRLAAAVVAGVVAVTLGAPVASADFQPVLATYEMPLVVQADGSLVSQAPMLYLGTQATATVSMDDNGGLAGIIQVGGLRLAVHGLLGGQIAPGLFMARLILPGGEAINPPTEPKLLDLPHQADIAAASANQNAAVLGAFMTAEGILDVPLPAVIDTTQATVPVGLGRDRTAAATFAGFFTFKGALYHAIASVGEALQVTFSGGRLSEAVQVTFQDQIAPNADTITLNVPTYWAEAWNAGQR